MNPVTKDHIASDQFQKQAIVTGFDIYLPLVSVHC
ncbi:uncharacterized protein METZ01_LOCUS387205 [marine metagenome]|uniref:Uncharacterized protein n=1 Tax=marine metagenome TaxID=408172 RepID=A0A382UL00_9ZZZZ